jgi:GT2 family glycosyltransferase
VQRHTTAPLELVVVDNASTDGSADMVARDFPDAVLVRNPDNVGFARACNKGMAASRGRLLLLLNSDTYVEDDVIGRCARELMERSEYGMLGCELRFPNGRRQHTANRALSVRMTLLERLWLYRLWPAARRPKLLLGGYYEGMDDVEVDWLAGAFMLLRRELFESSGGFDERFFMYGEDGEWCMRLRRAGHKILFAPRLGTVIHVGAASADLTYSDRDRLRRGHLGGLEAYCALNGRSRAVTYLAAQLLGALVRWAVYAAVVRIRPGPYVAAQVAFYGYLVQVYATAIRMTPRWG